MEELFDAFFSLSGECLDVTSSIQLEFCCIIEFNNESEEDQVFDWNNKGKNFKGSGSNPEIKIRFHLDCFFLIPF
jgi:hypothetical protein